MDKKKRITMGVIAGVILVLLLVLVIVLNFPKKREDTVNPGDYVEIDTSNIKTLDEKSVLSENPVMQAPEAVKEMKPVVEAVVAAVTQTSEEAYSSKNPDFMNYVLAYYAAIQSEQDTVKISADDAEAVVQSIFAEQVTLAEQMDDTFQKEGDFYILKKFEQPVVTNAYDYEKTESGYTFYVEVMDATNYQTKETWKVNLVSAENTKFAYRVTEASKLSDRENDSSRKEASDLEISFAEELLEVVEKKDIQKFADMVKYPVLVNGKSIADKDNFLALGSDGVFTQELMDALKQTDADNLIFSDGCVMLGEGSYNIWYESKDTDIYVVGINN